MYTQDCLSRAEWSKHMSKYTGYINGENAAARRICTEELSLSNMEIRIFRIGKDMTGRYACSSEPDAANNTQ